MLENNATEPTEITLIPAKSHSVIGLAVSLTVVFVSLTFLLSGHGLAWFTFGAGLIGGSMFFTALLPGREWLRFDLEGFTCKTLFHETSVLWEHVEDIGITSVEGRRCVGFNLYENAPLPRDARRLMAYSNQYAYALPSNYAHSVKELAALMSDWHSRAQHEKSRAESAEA